MTESRVLAKLREGEMIRVVNISRVIEPWLAELAGKIGFDAIWLDLEHRDFGERAIGPMAVACRASRADLLVRVRTTAYTDPMSALECGANGLMLPHCRSVDDAKRWVQWCKFPPLGRRGFDGAGADADFMLADPIEHMRHANRETFLVVQIEDREAVDCIGDIAALEGIDVLFIGPADLTISLGIPMQFSHPVFTDAMARVSAAARAHGKAWGMATGTPAMAQEVADLGAQLITCGSDHAWLVNGLRSALTEYSAVERSSSSAVV